VKHWPIAIIFGMQHYEETFLTHMSVVLATSP